jgi:NAD+ diphosphatase
MMMPGEFIPSVIPLDSQKSDAWWFIFSGYRLLVDISANAATVPRIKEPEKLGINLSHRIYLGSFRGLPCYAAVTEHQDEDPTGIAFQDLRFLYHNLEDGFFEVALTAIHLVEWVRTYQFCTTCRGELRLRTDMRAKECEKCGRLEFPRLSPAIIVLIEKEDTLLLARSSRFTGEFFSVLAGFVEPGESLEDAVRREVMEEVGISVKAITYFGSQPWPFPDSLMIGYTAQYESGEIRIDGDELVEAGWYRAENLPRIPGKLSIARQLIDWFVEKHTGD